VGGAVEVALVQQPVAAQDQERGGVAGGQELLQVPLDRPAVLEQLDRAHRRDAAAAGRAAEPEPG
jgi:hypothetical protein